MGYLIIQIIVCLLIAALIGFILGWLLRGLGCKDSIENEGTGSAVNNKTSTLNTLSSSGSSSQTDDFYPEPVTKAPAKPREKVKPDVSEKTKRDFSVNKSTKSTPSFNENTGTSGTSNFSANSSDSIEKSHQSAEKTPTNTPKNESEAKTANLSDNKTNINTSTSTSSWSPKTDESYPEPVTKAPAISHKIEKIEGIGKSLGNKTRKIGIKTTKDLLKTCATKTGFQQVVDATKVTSETVTQWVSMADLMRIANIDGQIAELMLASGIKSPEVLASADPQALTKEMLTVNNREKKIPSSIELPNTGKIEEMIKIAKTL